MALLNTTTPLSTFGAIGTGILHPIVKHRFCVSFHKFDGSHEKLSFSDDLARQTVRFSDFSQGPGELLVEVEDDISNIAAKAVQALLELPEGVFCFVVSYLDGADGVIKQAKFNNCRADVSYSGMDYSRPRQNKLQLDVPLTQGDLIDKLGAHPAALAVMTVLNGARFALSDKHEPSAIAQHYLSIEYESVEFIFP